MFLVRMTTPPLEALYALPPAVPSRPSTLAIVTTEPRRPFSAGWSSIRADHVLGHEEGAGQVDDEHPVPLGGVQHVHGARAGHPGGRDHAVDPPEPLDGRLHGRSTAASSVTSVSRNSHRAPAVVPCWPRHVRTHDLGALLEQPLGRRPPDSRCRTRDDDGPVPRVPARLPPSCCPGLNTMIEVVQMSSRGPSQTANGRRDRPAGQRGADPRRRRAVHVPPRSAPVLDGRRGRCSRACRGARSTCTSRTGRRSSTPPWHGWPPVRVQQRARRAPPSQPGGPGRGGGRVHPGAPRRPASRCASPATRRT